MRVLCRLIFVNNGGSVDGGTGFGGFLEYTQRRCRKVRTEGCQIKGVSYSEKGRTLGRYRLLVWFLF